MASSIHIDHPAFQGVVPPYDLKRSAWRQNIEAIQIVDKDIEEYDTVYRPLQKRLAVIEKVILVAIPLIMLAMPFASQFPGWVTWGVGVPTVLILGYLAAPLKRKIEKIEHKYNALLLMRALFQDQSLQALMPIGEWDLPAVDKRLRSDLIMQKELEKRHPESAKHVNRLVSELDLDVTPFMRIQAAHKLAQLPKTTEWGIITESVIEAKELLQQRDVEGYEQKMARVRMAALRVGGPPPYTLPLQSAQSEVEAVLARYQFFCKLYEQLDLEEGEERDLFIEWVEDIHKIAEELKQKDWEEAASFIRSRHFSSLIDLLIDTTHKLIADQPAKRIEAYRIDFEEYDKKMLDVQTLLELKGWIDAHPDKAQDPMGQVIHQLPRAEAIKQWMKKHKDWIVDPVIEVYERNALMRDTYQKALPSIQALTPEGLNTFQKEVMSPLKKVVDYRGELSYWKRNWKQWARKLPAHPFEPANLIVDQTFGIARRTEELVVNDALKQIDGKMVLSNRIRRYGLEWAVMSVVLVAQIFFLSNPWVVLGFGIVGVAVKGLSVYVDRRLHKLDKSKQSEKLQLVVRDRLLVSRIPGSRPILRDLRKAQLELGLDGVARTWSRVLAEGDEGVFTHLIKYIDADIRVAKQLIKNIVSEGNEMVDPRLEKRYLSLCSARALGYTQFEDEIKELERTLYSIGKKKQTPTRSTVVGIEWTCAVRKRQACEVRLKEIEQEILNLQGKEARSELAKHALEKTQQALTVVGIEWTCAVRKRQACEVRLKEIEQEILNLQGKEARSELAKHVLEKAQQALSEIDLPQLAQDHNRAQEEENHLACSKEYLEARQAQLQGFASVDLDPAQMTQLEKMEEDAIKALEEAQRAEKIAQVLVALEKQLVSIVPNIEEKRFALVKDARDGDESIQSKLEKNITQFNQQLDEKKQTLARALVLAAEQQDSHRVEMACNTFLQDLEEIVDDFNSAAETEEGRLSDVLRNQARLIERLLRKEAKIAHAVGGELNAELNILKAKTLNERMPTTRPTLLDLFDEAVNNRDETRAIKLYSFFNLPMRTAVWWRLPRTFKDACGRAKAQLMEFLKEGCSDPEQLRTLYQELTYEDKVAVFKRLPKPFQEEIEAFEKESKEAFDRIQAVLSGRNDEDIYPLLEQLCDRDWTRVFPLLPHEVREELV